MLECWGVGEGGNVGDQEVREGGTEKKEEGREDGKEGRGGIQEGQRKEGWGGNEEESKRGREESGRCDDMKEKKLNNVKYLVVITGNNRI